jgi:pimeloyl-ACP methyl ester carboxylesterase/ketosteroid isomerase-like protein
MTTYRSLSIDGLDVFVREAGDANSPPIVLLHGFPTSSHMFRELIPRLADRFRVIAPDMIGFGNSSAPPASEFAYTFDNLAAITAKVLERLEVPSYVLYLHDYGGPVGLRVATAAPERVRGLVVQNANAYQEGISEALADLFVPLWKEQNDRTVGAAKGFLRAEATKMQYTAGARDAAALDPTAWTLDQAWLDRPGMADAQLALFVDYEKNVALYDAWHAFFRQRQPKTLVIWGQRDPFFLAAGAEAYRRDLRDAEVVLLEGGHFLLEESADVVAAHIARVFAEPTAADLAASFYRSLASGSLAGALALLASDVSWNDPKGFPYGGTLEGREPVRDRVFARIAADWEPFLVEAESITPLRSGQEAFAVGRYRGKSRLTGVELDARFVHLWSAASGALTRFETFTDTAALRDAIAR